MWAVSLYGLLTPDRHLGDTSFAQPESLGASLSPDLLLTM